MSRGQPDLFDCKRDCFGMFFFEPRLLQILCHRQCVKRGNSHGFLRMYCSRTLIPSGVFQNARRSCVRLSLRSFPDASCNGGRRPAGHACVQRLSLACSVRANFARLKTGLEIQLNCADCVGTALSAADNTEIRRAVVAVFRRRVHGILEQFRCSLGCPANQIMQATEAAGAEFLAASLQPDAVTMTLDHDETLVPY